jgi:hypothetical protein
MSYTIDHKGKKVLLPDFGQIPTGVIRKARNEDVNNQTWFILESLLTPKDLEVIDSLPLNEFTKHMTGWTNGVGLGE